MGCVRMTTEATGKDELERMAACIADDEQVAWPAMTPGDDAMRGLRVLQQLVQGFRHLHVSAIASQLPSTHRLRFGALTLLELLGSGSQGEVWRAYEPMLDMQVALKLRKLDSGILAHDFLREARRLARVRQANIVSVYGAAVCDGRAGLWMELIRGDSLTRLLELHGPMSPEEVRGIGLDLCRALASVHRHGLVHGDIKTDNVMRDVSGRIVLTDFGAACDQDAAAANVVSGTVNYLAPEVLRGAPPSPCSDIYALGVLLFRLLGNAFPYTGPDLPNLMQQQERGLRVQLAALRKDLPEKLLGAIESAIAIDPARRPASALALAAALAPPAIAMRRRWPMAMAAAAVVALATATAIVGALFWRAAPAWQTEVAFYRVRADASVALNDGAAVAMGDRLALHFRSNAPAHVYVFDDDGSGQTAVLFPLPGLKTVNPLAANVDYRLPGAMDAAPLTWQVSSDAVREQFIVVAADAPQPSLERRIAAWRHAQRPGAVRGALELAQDAQAMLALSPDLQRLLAELGPPDDTHLRRWRFVFPHATNARGADEKDR